jgi:integrase/recombinase XerC
MSKRLTVLSSGRVPEERELLECFLSGRNPRTLAAYRIDLDGFAQFCGSDDLHSAIRAFIALTPGQANSLVMRYRNALLDRGLQATTVNRRLAAIRSLATMARTLGLITWCIEVSNMKTETYRDTRGPGRAAVAEMMSNLGDPASPKYFRDCAILRLLYDLALRASEVIQIDLTDVNSDRTAVSILGKGKKQKVEITLPPATKAALADWIRVRRSDVQPLFYNFDRAGKGCRLTRNGLYELVRRLGERVGVKTRPHGIRHTAITQAIKAAQLNGITLPEVRQFSRHASLQTLQIYADKERDLAGRIATLVSQTALAPNANGAEIEGSNKIVKPKTSHGYYCKNIG